MTVKYKESDDPARMLEELKTRLKSTSSDPMLKGLSELLGLSGGFVIEISSRGLEEETINLGSAHYNFNVANLLPRETAWRLQGQYHALLRGDLRLPRAEQTFDVENVIRTKLAEETGITGGRILPVSGQTRYALIHTLDNLAVDGKPIALPYPNWHFWELNEDFDRDYRFSHFDGSTPERLVEGFRKAAQRERLGGLILVQPSTPLGTIHDEETIKTIDAIAQRYGVPIVVDDVLRGVQDDKRSIARWLTQPYLVEGFSKRFGDTPLGTLSYIHVPAGARAPLAPMMYGTERTVYGELLENAFRFAQEPALEELRRRNRAFDDGLLRGAPAGTLVDRASMSSLTSVVTLPDGFLYSAQEFCDDAQDNGIVTIPICDFVPGRHSLPHEFQKKFRITVGHHDPETLGFVGAALGEGMSIYMANRSRERD